MNTQLAFAFGMLAMVAITMLVVLVVGMVKVIKLANKLENLEQQVGREVELIHRHSSDVERNFYSELNEFKRRVESSPVIDDVHRRIDDEVRCINEEIQNTHRHIDSRFDKFENKIMTKVEPDMTGIDLVIEKTTKKQLLKD